MEGRSTHKQGVAHVGTVSDFPRNLSATIL